MNLDSSFSNPSFKGRREDIKNVQTLSGNNMPILPNKKTLILSAIDNLGKTGERQDIEMLMGTVETMKYGIRNNSEFAKVLGGTQGEKENTDWDGILQTTIQTAIDGTTGEDREALEARFQQIFGQEEPLTEQQKTMLQLRSDILNSDEMTSVLGDSEKTLEAARITENLDYFIASSEINNEDKVQCLGLMKHFLSDDYEIHPQLKNHKVQAFSEMLNDLIVKRPDEDAYTIKDVSQKQTGMCAAISIARKTIAYEDKVRAMEIMMAELDNKPTMEVYDRTAIGTGKKVEIQKAHVDFTDGMKKGYRIVDTGTHQWMNAADTVGNGSVATGHYQAFDPDNYEIFRDAHWRNDLPEQFKPAQNWLRYLDKETEAIDTAQRRSRDIAKIQREIGEHKKSYEMEVVKSDAAIRDTLKLIDPTVSDTKATTLTRQILKADKSENPEFKIIDREPRQTKSQKLTALIKSELPNASDEVLAEKIDSITGLRELSVSATEKLDKLKRHTKPESIFAHNKNLFIAAAHHRRSVQAELEVPERLSAYEKALNVPVRDTMVQDSAQKILSNLSSKSMVETTAERFGTEPNADAVKFAVQNALTETEVEIPSKLDGILREMQMGDRVTVISSFLDDAAARIQDGDTETMMTYAENAHIKPDSAQVLKKIETVRASLADNPSNKQITEAANLLGYSNQIEMTADMYKSFVGLIDEGGLSNEQLTAVFGDNPSEKIKGLGKEIKSVSNRQAQIEKQFGLPSRKDVVLGILEATGEVVSEKSLQEMQAKFDRVAEAKSESDNRIVDPSVKKQAVPDSVYKFTPAEKEMYVQIEAKLPAWKTYAEVNAHQLNAALAPQLDSLSAETGRLSGQLWVGAEGSSGLYDNQSIKVLEMITGKHYYNEADTDKVVERIKQGNGSGTSSTNVSHTEYSGHAQYVAEVSQVAVMDPETKETVMKDVLWHDNTWGRAEDKKVWTDERGVQRTDYGNEYGGPDGYVFNKNLFTGTFVEDTKYQVGTTESGDKFRLWTAVRLAGENPEAEKKISGVIDDILSIGSADQTVSEFEAAIRKAPAVDMKTMDFAGEMMTKVSDENIKKIEKANIQTDADVESLQDQDLKFLLQKTALQMSVPSKGLKEYITNIIDAESLAQVKDQLPELQREMMSAPFLKGPSAPREVFKAAQDQVIEAFNTTFTDENVPQNLQEIFTGLIDVPADQLDGSVANLKEVMVANAAEKISESVDDEDLAAVLSEKVAQAFESTIDNQFVIHTIEDFTEGNDTADLMIKYVDKKFNTSSDADLLAALQQVQNMSNEEYNAFIADMTPEEMGIKDVTPANVAREINAQKGIATDLFSTNTRLQVLFTTAPEDQEAPEWLYHSMKQSVSPVENSEYVAKMGATMFDKYGVRAAFPEAKIMSDEEIVGQVSDTLAYIQEAVKAIKTAPNKGVAAAQLNAEIKSFVSTNIVEGQQSKTMGLFKSYVKALKNNSPEADAIAANVANAVVQEHIVKNPNELLQTFVREIQSENPDEAKVDQLREYLTQAVSVSEFANVEYGLIQNAEDGIETMTKQAFENYTLTTNDGRTVTLNSDEGVLFLVDKLANPQNGSTALQVLFAHTGLSEQAVDVISDSIQMADVEQMCEQITPELKTIYGNIGKLNGDFEEFATDNTVAYSSYKDAVKHYIQTMDKKYADRTEEEQEIYAEYKDFLLKTQNADSAKNIDNADILPLLAKVHELGVQALNNQGANIAQTMNDLVLTLDKRVSAMKALKLPENSPKEQARQEFIANGEATLNKLAESIQEINESIS